MRFEVVLGMLAVTAAVLLVVPQLRTEGAAGGDHKAITDAEMIARAILDYRHDTGVWPPTRNGALDPGCLADAEAASRRTRPAVRAELVGTLAAAPDPSGAPLRAWLQEVPLDPWFHPFRAHLVPGAGGTQRLVVLSAGADGEFQTPPLALADEAEGPATGCRGDDLGFVLAGQGEARAAF